jgi:hypothetical protein
MKKSFIISSITLGCLALAASSLFGQTVFTEDFNDNEISDWTAGSERNNHPFGTFPDIVFTPVAAGGMVQLQARGSCRSAPFDGVASTLAKTISLPNGTYILSYDVSNSTHHYNFCSGATAGDSEIFVNGLAISPAACSTNACLTCTVPTTTMTGFFCVTNGSVELKLRANAGDCADTTGIFDNIIITAVNKCPLGQGYWKNHPSDWPVNTLTLGTVSYTQEQLLAILNSSVKGDASLILAYQLIAAKLNAANGSNPCASADTIAAADALIGGRTIPIIPKITPNSPEGQQMVSLAATLEQYNSQVTPGCTP